MDPEVSLKPIHRWSRLYLLAYGQDVHHADMNVAVLDDLCTVKMDALGYGEFFQGSIADHDFLDGLFSRHQFDAVMHFAAFIEVGESVSNPAK